MVNFCSKIVFCSILSCILFGYVLLITFFNSVEKTQLNSVYIARLNETSKILSDKRWISWAMPKDYVEYCIMWIFDRNPRAKVEFKGEAELDYKVKSCIFEVILDGSDIGQLNLSNIPFGSIKILATEGRKYTVEWRMSTELKECDSIKPIAKSLRIKVQSIVTYHSKEKNGSIDVPWKVKMNDQLIKATDRSPWNNVEIVDVRHDYVEVKVYTPKEVLYKKIACGEELAIDYL